PDEVELFLDRQRPQHTESRVARIAQRLPDIRGEKCVPPPLLEPAEAEEQRRQNQQQNVRRQNTLRATCVKITEIRLIARFSIDQNTGYQETAEHEEKIDAHP